MKPALAGGCLLLGAAPAARGEPAATRDEAPTLRIEEPPPLHAGTTSEIGALVRVPGRGEQPLLLTPRIDGDALRMVRGRLLRADARRLPDGALRFALPVIATGPGTAVLRVELSTYVCRPRCKPVRISARRVLTVLGPSR